MQGCHLQVDSLLQSIYVIYVKMLSICLYMQIDIQTSVVYGYHGDTSDWNTECWGETFSYFYTYFFQLIFHLFGQ